ncbi:MAG: hypothetical protein K2O92_01745 [Lachnospiraceae bacterium]|nr:hypothetical protein [Lachnospiraceae bacterium]
MIKKEEEDCSVYTQKDIRKTLPYPPPKKAGNTHFIRDKEKRKHKKDEKRRRG